MELINRCRRNFLQTAAISSAGVGLGIVNPVFAAAKAPQKVRRVDEVLAMTPIQMAKESQVVQVAYKVLLESADLLDSPKVRETVKMILKKPDVTLDLTQESALVPELKKAGFLSEDDKDVFPAIGRDKVSPQPTWSAPGSGYGSHHAYPGGLAVHVALNVLSARKLLQSYKDNNDCILNLDDALGGELLHDLHKPWVFQWQKDHSCRKEQILAGTGEHHVLSLAESMRRNLPATLCVAQACAHQHPGTEAGLKLVTNWIRCAAMIAGVDPVKAGYLAKDGKTLPEPLRTEGFVVHLADHDFVISTPACRWTVNALKTLAKDSYGIDAEKSPAQFNALRNYVLANLTAMRLHAVRSSEGDAAFAREVARVLRA